jgi:hypothetical protein
VRRREFIILISGAAASPILHLRAQQSAMTRVGIVTIQSPTSHLMPHSVSAYMNSDISKVKTLVWISSTRHGKPEVTQGLFRNSFVESQHRPRALSAYVSSGGRDGTQHTCSDDRSRL